MPDRQQHVLTQGAHSPSVKPIWGVLQGSVLDPLFFSIFTTWVGDFLKSFEVSYHQYVDSLYITIDLSATNWFSVLSACADAVTRWHLENDLLLNRTETVALVPGTRQDVAELGQSAGITVPQSSIPFDDQAIRCVAWLGVTIDSQLPFSDPIT